LEFKDYYLTPSVARDATAEDIKKAFRKLARQYHPGWSGISMPSRNWRPWWRMCWKKWTSCGRACAGPGWADAPPTPAE